ncbi:MAG TPA: M48 family metalloprotease [Candidatus Methylomirabilis sp.]|nr:M48 family metalloprotease [Candidatus Methylomirabilis sp.]
MPTDDRARSYHRWQLWLAGAGLLLTVCYLVLLIWTGGAIALHDRLSGLTGRWWIELPMMLIILGAAHWLLLFPLRCLTGFLLPRRFGLLRQPFHRWLWDGVKSACIGGLLAILGAEVVYGLLRTTSWWWLWSALAFFVGYCLLAWVAPVWLVPLFYRLVPLDDTGLRERLLAVAARASVPVLGVWVADQSRKGRTANAAVVGLGGTRRIVLFDTLISEFPAAEVEAVLAHELAHQVHHDVERGLLVQGAVTAGTFWVAAWWLGALAPRAGLSGPADLGGLPLLGLIFLALGLLALPLGNAWSRRVERQADDFALRMASEPDTFVTAMERLADLNLAEPDPHPVKEFLLYSHPSIARRIARARLLLRAHC